MGRIPDLPPQVYGAIKWIARPRRLTDPANPVQARLYIRVGHKTTYYWCHEHWCDDPYVVRMWRIDGDAGSYWVTLQGDGYMTCDCGDSTFRTLGCCKHCRAIVAGYRALGGGLADGLDRVKFPQEQ